MRKIKRKTHEDRKAEIIQTTLAVAADDKSSKITTQVIADKLKISQPTIFKHFKNNEILFLAVVEWVSDNIFPNFGSGFLSETDSPEDKIKNLITAQAAFLNKHPGVARLIFSNHVYKGPKKLKFVVQKIMSTYITNLTVLIEGGIQSGHFRRDLNASDGAKLVVSTFHGVVVRWSVHDFNFELLDEMLPLLQLILVSFDNPDRKKI